MTRPPLSAFFQAIDVTWAPAAMHREGPWMFREGKGGGQRASATTAEETVSLTDIDLAEARMAEMGQRHLFMIRDGEDRLDAMLDVCGYQIKDPVALYAIPTANLTTEQLPLVTAFDIWPPLAIITDIWARGGIDIDRVRLMERVAVPKTAILARQNDQPAGAAFIAIHDNVAMIHAIEVVPALRKMGVGTNILRAGAQWAQDQGAAHLALAVTRANQPANALYRSLGMGVVGHYHYRIK